MFVGGLFLGALLGALGGAVLVWALTRARYAGDLAAARGGALENERMAQVLLAESQARAAAAQARLDASALRVDELAAELEQRRSDVEAARAAAAGAQAEASALAARLESEQQAAAEKLTMLTDIVQQADAKLREAFASLSSDALRRNNQSFIELAKETLGVIQQQASGDLERRQQAIDALVKPVRETLDKFDARIHDVEKARVEAYSSLREQVTALAETQQHLHSETSNLVKALRAPNVRGRWGEIQLKRVVELAGMLEHCDFDEQRTVETGDGRIRPDLVVRLPGGRVVVVDAKTPLDAYIAALETDDEKKRVELLQRHSKQVRDHVAKLSSKQYWSQFERTPDFVFMFIPGETFFSAALQQDPALIEFGVEQRVILASPTTLITHLQSVAWGWRQQQIEENALHISALGRTLYERLQTMAAYFENVGRALDRAVEAYNRTVGSLESRVMVQARRFSELGVSTAELPELTTVDRSARSLHPSSMPLALDVGDDVDEETAGLDSPPGFLTAEVS
jgi:DNA recombination protein RmuC